MKPMKLTIHGFKREGKASMFKYWVANASVDGVAHTFIYQKSLGIWGFAARNDFTSDDLEFLDHALTNALEDAEDRHHPECKGGKCDCLQTAEYRSHK